jgi:hypothetical protein
MRGGRHVSRNGPGSHLDARTHPLIRRSVVTGLYAFRSWSWTACRTSAWSRSCGLSLERSTIPQRARASERARGRDRRAARPVGTDARACTQANTRCIMHNSNIRCMPPAPLLCVCAPGSCAYSCRVHTQIHTHTRASRQRGRRSSR